MLSNAEYIMFKKSIAIVLNWVFLLSFLNQLKIINLVKSIDATCFHMHGCMHEENNKKTYVCYEKKIEIYLLKAQY